MIERATPAQARVMGHMMNGGKLYVPLISATPQPGGLRCAVSNSILEAGVTVRKETAHLLQLHGWVKPEPPPWPLWNSYCVFRITPEGCHAAAEAIKAARPELKVVA